MGDEERRARVSAALNQPLMSAAGMEGREGLADLAAFGDIYRSMTNDQLRRLSKIIRNKDRQIPLDIEEILLERGIQSI